MNSSILRIIFVAILGFAGLNICSAETVRQVKPMTFSQEEEFIAKYKLWLKQNGNDFRPALSWAAIEGEVWFVEMLLRHNESIDEEEKAGGNALSAAILNERENIVELLLFKGANPNITYSNQMNGVKPIILAAQGRNKKILTLLIKEGVDVNYTVPDKYQTTALYTALFHDQLDLARLLITSGAIFKPYRYPDGTIPVKVMSNACIMKQEFEKTFVDIQCN